MARDSGQMSLFDDWGSDDAVADSTTSPGDSTPPVAGSDLSGHEAMVRREWGMAAWAWMAEWCPTSLAAMPDPVAHFTAIDNRLRAEQVRLRETTPLLAGETPGAFQFRVSDLVKEQARAERPPPEVERPVWDREWSDVIRYRHPMERRADGTWLRGRRSCA